MLKQDLGFFFDSLKAEGKLVVIEHIYRHKEAKKSLDLYYFRAKLEEMFKDCMTFSPVSLIELIEIQSLRSDLEEWSTNTLHLILEKSLELGREEPFLNVLKTCTKKLSTVKIVDHLKRVMILDKFDLAKKILEIGLESLNHGKSNRPITRLS